MSEGQSILSDAGVDANASNASAAKINEKMTVALIDDGSVQLDQLCGELSKGLELLSKVATVTTFKSVHDLRQAQRSPSLYDAIIIGYHTPMNEFLQEVARLKKEYRPNCKICVFSSNTLDRAERTCLNGLGIRFFQNPRSDRSACSKILNLLSSPDLRKCSSCTRWKPITDFSGW